MSHMRPERSQLSDRAQVKRPLAAPAFRGCVFLQLAAVKGKKENKSRDQKRNCDVRGLPPSSICGGKLWIICEEGAFVPPKALPRRVAGRSCRVRDRAYFCLLNFEEGDARKKKEGKESAALGRRKSDLRLRGGKWAKLY